MPKSTKDARRARLAGKHPDWTRAQLDDAVRASYLSKDPEKRAKQCSGLTPHARKHKHTAKVIAKATVSDLEHLDIVTFSRDILRLTLWPSQETLLRALYALPMSADDLSRYGTMTRRTSVDCGPTQEADEGVWALGARAGKSLLASIIALYECTARAARWRASLRKSEIGYAVIVATRLQQAQDIVQAGAARLATNSPLKDMIAGEPTQTRLEFKNGLCILSLPCNSTAGRGLPIFCLILDECAHYFTEGVKADTDIYGSLCPRLAQFPGAKTLLPSTPSAKQGLFWRWFKEGFDVAGRVTVQAPTEFMNPAVDRAFLEKIRLRDPDNYAREFDAQFAESASNYFTSDTVDAALVLDGDVSPADGVDYHLAIDQSGATGRDRFGAAVAHCEEDGRVIVDALRSWDTRNLDMILEALGLLAGRYRAGRVLCDAYASGWVTTALNKLGLEAERRPGLPQVYSNTRSLMTAGKLQAPGSGELRAALLNTTAFFGSNNSLSIVHERTAEGHADVADAVATAVWSASGRTPELQRAFSDADIDRCLKAA